MSRLVLIPLCAGLVQACVQEPDFAPAYDFIASESDPARAQMQQLFQDAQGEVEAFWGEVGRDTGFKQRFTVTLAADRAAFDSALPAEWGIVSQCWMVGLGVADRLVYLSPSTWMDDACEHDPDDLAHIREIAIHEMVHVHHGQHHPVGDFTGSEALSWLIEGLAVLAAGQLTDERLARAGDDIASGELSELEQAWSGPHRYAVAGSMAAYVDETYGRTALWDMLAMTQEAQVLSRIDVSEAEFLSGWRAWVDDRLSASEP